MLLHKVRIGVHVSCDANHPLNGFQWSDLVMDHAQIVRRAQYRRFLCIFETHLRWDFATIDQSFSCLLYTSDAADEEIV